MTFMRQIFTIAGKDLLLEVRSRERVVGMFTFAVLVAVVFSFSLDPTVQAIRIAGAMLWVTILFAGMLGLGRSFTLEKEQDALVGILLTPVDRSAFFLGKFLANLVLLLATTLVIFLVYGLFFQLPLGGAWAGLGMIALFGCIGFMAVGTLFSAVAASTRLGDTLLPILLLPLLFPVVVFGTSATQLLLLGRPLLEVYGNVRMLAAFALIFVVVGALVFGWVVED